MYYNDVDKDDPYGIDNYKENLNDIDENNFYDADENDLYDADR